MLERRVPREEEGGERQGRLELRDNNVRGCPQPRESMFCQSQLQADEPCRAS